MAPPFASLLFLLMALSVSIRCQIDEAAIKNRRVSMHTMKRLKVAHWYLFPYRRSGIDARLYDEHGMPYDEKKPKAEPGFTYLFPRPAVKTFSLHSGIQKHCKNDKTVEPCLDYIYHTLERAKSMKGDMLLTSHEDFTPFADRFMRFQFRQSAMYYLCWHTMKRDPLLKFFGFNCGPTPFDLSDYRYDNVNGPPWGCALTTFCPDPCCGNVTTSIKPVAVKGEFQAPNDPACTAHTSFPCEGIQNATCNVDMVRNTDFDSVRQNRWNLTCGCPTGYRWDSRGKMCFDIDECYEGTHGCRINRVCRNTIGKYRCDCLYSYAYDNDAQECIKHVELDAVLMERKEQEINLQMEQDSETTLQKSWKTIKKNMVSIFAVPSMGTGVGVASNTSLIAVLLAFALCML